MASIPNATRKPEDTAGQYGPVVRLRGRESNQSVNQRNQLSNWPTELNHRRVCRPRPGTRCSHEPVGDRQSLSAPPPIARSRGVDDLGSRLSTLSHKRHGVQPSQYVWPDPARCCSRRAGAARARSRGGVQSAVRLSVREEGPPAARVSEAWGGLPAGEGTAVVLGCRAQSPSSGAATRK